MRSAVSWVTIDIAPVVFPLPPIQWQKRKAPVIHLLPLSVYSERGTPMALHAPFTSAAVEPEAYTRPENLLIAW